MEFRTIGGSISIQSLPGFLKTLGSVSSNCNTVIQAMDADRIAGKEHIDLAVRKALRAKENNYNVARDIGIEIMRYASGKRQIEDAFSMGVREGDMNIVFVVLGDTGNVEDSIDAIREMIDEAPVTDYHISKKAGLVEQFMISDKEIEAAGEEMLRSLVLERVALVDVLK